jgi:hypothetical protein
MAKTSSRSCDSPTRRERAPSGNAGHGGTSDALARRSHRRRLRGRRPRRPAQSSYRAGHPRRSHGQRAGEAPGRPARPRGGIAQAQRFLEVETNLDGATVRGFVWAAYLARATGVSDAPIVPPAPTADALVAVDAPRRPGTLTTRTAPATAQSLNEPGQPDGRRGTNVGSAPRGARCDRRLARRRRPDASPVHAAGDRHVLQRVRARRLPSRRRLLAPRLVDRRCHRGPRARPHGRAEARHDHRRTARQRSVSGGCGISGCGSGGVAPSRSTPCSSR